MPTFQAEVRNAPEYHNVNFIRIHILEFELENVDRYREKSPHFL